MIRVNMIRCSRIKVGISRVSRVILSRIRVSVI